MNYYFNYYATCGPNRWRRNLDGLSPSKKFLTSPLNNTQVIKLQKINKYII